MPWNDVAVAGAHSQCPGPAGEMLLNEQTGTVARSFSRDHLVGSGGPTSGTAYMRMIVLPAGLTAGAMTLYTTTIGKLGGSHGWYVVTDQNMNVLAVTADYTDAATTWGTTWTPYKLPFTSPLATAYTGVYYAGIMCVASTMPAIGTSGVLLTGAYAMLPPVLNGLSSTGQTTPPAAGAQLAALTASSGSGLYITLQSG